MRYLAILATLTALAFLLVVAPVFRFDAEAAGTQYYVDSAAGSDSNNGTSSSSPWKSLSAVANRTFSAGDTINFKAGSSFSGGLTFKSSGTASAPIILQPYGSGARPVFSASGAGSNAIRLDANYVTAKGFLLKDAENGVRVSDSFHHNTIEDNEIAGTGLGLLLYGDYNRVIGNYIHDLKMVRNTSSSSTDDYGANGVMLNNSKGDEIAYNRFVNNRAPSIDYGYDGGAVEMWGAVSDINVHHNYSSGGQGFLEQGGGDVANIRLASNESSGDYMAFVMLHLDPTHTHGGTATNFVMEGNTIVRNRTPKGYRILDIQGSPSSSQVMFKNNLVYSNMSIARDGDHGHTGNKYFLVDGAVVGYSPLGSGETSQSGSGINVDSFRYDSYFAVATSPAAAPAPTNSPTPAPTTAPAAVPTTAPAPASSPTPAPVPTSTATPAPSPTPAPVTSTELVTNGGFDSGSTGWSFVSPVSGAVSVQSAARHEGSAGLRLTGKASDPGPAGQGRESRSEADLLR